MNKIFKVIWNPATGSYSVASETAKSRGKKSGRSKLLISALVAGGLLSSFGAYAAFTGDGGKSAEEAAGGTPLTDGWIAIGKGAIATAGAPGSGTSSVAVGQEANSGLGSTALGYKSNATGERSVALGQVTVATGSRAIAIGSAAKATKDFTIALGNTAQANSDYAMALGKESNASGLYSLAIGYKSVTSKDNAIALGNGSQSSGVSSIAMGQGSHASGDYSLALGDLSDAGETSAIALGQGSNASKINSIALGSGSSSSGDNAIALGLGSSAGGNDSLAFGSQSESKGNNSVAIGVGAKADPDNSVAIGAGSVTNAIDTVSVGNDTTKRKIVNMAKGTISNDSTDAINGSQLYAISKSVADRLGGSSGIGSDGTITAPSYKLKSGTYNNVGEALFGIDNDTLHWDKTQTAFSASYIVRNADGTIKSTVAQNKIINVADGEVSSSSFDAINGSQLQATKDDVAANTTSITNLSNDVADNTTNITTLQDAVDGLGDDALQWDSGKTAFSAAHGASTTSKITNVTAGDLTAASTDAINGSQLYDFSSAIADTLGGGSTVGADGMFSAPTYTIGGTDYDNLGDALTAINASVGTSLGDALMWDDSSKSYSASRAGVTSKITNVAAGALSATSTDAVNGSQLYGVSNSVVDALGGGSTMNADGTINAPTYSIANTDYSNIGDALSAIDASLDDSLLWDASAGAFSAAHGTDAVNGSQLFTTNQMITQIAGNTSNTYVEEHGAGVNYIRTNDTGLVFEDAMASGIGATAVGYNSVASATGSVAIGQDSRSNVESGVALGSGSVSDRVIVKGSRNTSVTGNGVVIGYDTTDGELLGALSIGDDGKYRQIINVADGSEAHDAVTVRQLQNAIGSVATTPTKYYHANSTAEDSLAVGEDSLAIGAKTIVNGDAGIGIGLNTLVLADAINGIAIGSNAHANHANSIAMGNGSETTRGAQTGYTAYNMDAPQNSVGEFSVGSEDGQRQITNVAAGSQDTDAVNVGQLKVTDAQVAQNTQSITNLNTQVGNLDTRVSTLENGMGDIITTGSTKYFKTNTDGVDANAQGKDSVAIGSGSIAAADNSVALGTGSEANEENTVSVGSSTNQRRITNVAAGKNDTDAVNVAQLKSSEAGSVRYATNEDGSINYTTMNLGDGKGGTTRISNVSAGVNNNDAVNYAQLKQSVQETKQYTDQRMVEMDNKLSKTESKLSGGIASAMAMTGLPQAYTPGASMTSIGGGTYNGESAVALGVSMVSANGRWVYKLQGSTNSQGEYSAAVGAGIQW
ncbi:YadA-like family protein [Escherichia albertii]|uniref:YadA-like family protein n=1 Tax=Escherichia albertii TaxID=208962 RepID=UPI0007440D16|nr:YadA-like family protein [Escherichia albertii]